MFCNFWELGNSPRFGQGAHSCEDSASIALDNTGMQETLSRVSIALDTLIERDRSQIEETNGGGSDA